MQKILVCLHTVKPLLGLFDCLVAEILPDIKLIHILDEPLLVRVSQRGKLEIEETNRVQAHRKVAEQIGAFSILVTCSTISPCVEDVRRLPGIPIYKIDEVMIRQAVTLGRHVGVVATAETTLGPTKQLLIMEAERQNKQIQIELALVPNALKLLLEGETKKHDLLVKNSVLDLMQRSDIIVLAQASMARVLDIVTESECKVPVLSSPHLALSAIRDHHNNY